MVSSKFIDNISLYAWLFFLLKHYRLDSQRKSRELTMQFKDIMVNLINIQL